MEDILFTDECAFPSSCATSLHASVYEHKRIHAKNKKRKKSEKNALHNILIAFN